MRDVFNTFQVVQKLSEKEYCKLDDPGAFTFEAPDQGPLKLRVVLKRCGTVHSKLRSQVQKYLKTYQLYMGEDSEAKQLFIKEVLLSSKQDDSSKESEEEKKIDLKIG